MADGWPIRCWQRAPTSFQPQRLSPKNVRGEATAGEKARGPICLLIHVRAAGRFPSSRERELSSRPSPSLPRLLLLLVLCFVFCSPRSHTAFLQDLHCLKKLKVNKTDLNCMELVRFSPIITPSISSPSSHSPPPPNHPPNHPNPIAPTTGLIIRWGKTAFLVILKNKPS